MAGDGPQVKPAADRDRDDGLVPARRRGTRAACARLGKGPRIRIGIDRRRNGRASRHGRGAGCRVPGDDLVVRWGGEEFLVLALQVPAEQAEQLAEHLLKLIGERPVVVQCWPMQVTASIGQALFALPLNSLPVAWDQAMHLADIAL